GNTPYSRRPSNRKRHQAVTVIRNTVVVPPQTEVEREALLEFPIVFEEEAHLILMSVANSLWESLVVFKRVQLRRRLHVIELRNARNRSREETEQIPHSLVVACGGRAGKSRHIRAGRNCVRRNWRKGCIAAYNSRNAGDCDARVVSKAVTDAGF